MLSQNRLKLQKCLSLLRNYNGQSLFEVVIAVGLSALILTAAASLAATSVRNSGFTNNNAKATKYAQEEIEWLRGQKEVGWEDFVGPSSKIDIGGCDSTDSTLSWGDDCAIDATFTRTVSFDCYYLDRSSSPASKNPADCENDDSADINIVEALVTVSWTDAQGTHRVDSETSFTNWK